MSAKPAGAKAQTVLAPWLIAGLPFALMLVITFVADFGAWTWEIAFVAALMGSAGLLVGALWWRRWRERIADATAMAESLAALRFDARMRPGADEFVTLAANLNRAADRIGSLVGKLRREREQLEALLNASSDATVAIDATGRVAYLNDAARELFAPKDDAYRPFIEVVRDHDFSELLMAAARKRERSVRVLPYGQSQRWLQATAVPIDGAGDWAALAVFHDLTEVRRLDTMRRDFISNVSHELRTPLAGIKAAVETLQEGALDDRPAAVEFVGHIQRETDRMARMVEELLELSRIESGAAPMSFEELDAGALVQGTVRRFASQAERAGVAIVARVPEEEITIVGDEERLERALGNLVANALRFTNQGGRVELSVDVRGDQVLLAVRDNGIGIEPEHMARVFERFYKADRGRSNGGIGLGLAIVKHIAQGHGGEVSVASQGGQGSTFTISLPRR